MSRIDAKSKDDLAQKRAEKHVELCPFCGTLVDYSIATAYWLDNSATNKDVAELIDRSSIAEENKKSNERFRELAKHARTEIMKNKK
jgi:hypothetical protein